MKPDWCSEKLWDEAIRVEQSLTARMPNLANVGRIARALLQAEQRGRKAGLEEAAMVADEYAAEKEEMAPFEDTPDYTERMLVYAKHVRRVSALIRAKANEVKT